MESVATDIPRTMIRKKQEPGKTEKMRAAKLLVSEPVLVRRKINERSLYEFIKYFWDEMAVDEFRDNWHIREISKELERVAENVAEGKPKPYDLVINLPPGMTKTIMVNVAFPAWCWTKWYWMKFICGGHSDRLALEAAENCRDLVMSEKFQMVYPEITIKDTKSAVSNFRVMKKIQVYPGHAPRLKQGGGRYTTSVAGTTIGFHAHIQIADDPLNPKKEVTEASLREANYWVGKVLSTRKTNKKVTMLVLVMQRLHENDPSGYLLERKRDKIRHICLPAELAEGYEKLVKPVEWKRFYVNGLLDPVRLDRSVLEESFKDLGDYGYSGQMGQNPVPPTGGMFKPDRFQVVTVPLNPSKYESSVRSWDKAGTADGGAYTVGTRIHKLKNGKWYVDDVKRGQWGTDDREDIIRETAEVDGDHVEVVIEQEPGSGGKESAEHTVRNLAGFAVEVNKPQGDKSKEARAVPYSSQVNHGNVILLKAEWNEQFIREHRFFPRGKYKDQVDSAAQGFNHLADKRVARRLT